ncbi:MAG TPA: hypothetical protein PLV45_06260, partial [bacterium]|nr:hypothetical protein [bacterium]
QDWQHPERLEEARSREDELIMEMAASMQGQQKDMEATNRELETLAAAMGKAMETNDGAEVSRIQAQMEALANRINAAADAQNQTFETRQQAIKARDARIRFMFRVNVTNFDVSWFTREADIAGLPTYRREFDNPGTTLEGEHVVFVGNFSTRAYESTTWMELNADPAAPSTSVQSMVIEVSGDADHTRKLLESMNWTALRNLMQPKP